MASVRLAGRAAADLDDAATWYESRGARVGHQFSEAADAALATLARLPELYAPDENGRRVGRIGRFAYLIVYRYDPAANEVVVSAVDHARQGP